MSLILDGTNGLSDVDGTAATPAIRGTDTNTGIFFPAADTIAFAEGGTEVARFDSAGNLGIGTTSPSKRLNVKGVTNTDVEVVIQANASNDYNSILSFGDNVDNSGLILYSNFSNHMRFDTNGTERMRIDSSGNLLVGKTAQDLAVAGFQVRGDAPGLAQITRSGGEALALNRLASDGSLALFYRQTAQVGSISVTTSATAYNTSSDYRLKENIAPMTGALATVQQLKPVTYNWKVDGSSGQGFIAHELQAVVPDCVTGEKDAVDEEGNPQYQGIDTSFLVATLTAAIQELKTELDSVKAELAILKGAA